MKLDELKELNKANEDAKGDNDKDIKDELSDDPTGQTNDDQGNITDDDPDNKPDDDSALEPWQQTDDQSSDGVPVGTHIKVKQKLKGRISERDDEITRLKAEIEKLKTGNNGQADTTELPKRPKPEDYDTDEEYQAALDQYDDNAMVARLDKAEQQRRVKEAQTQARQALDAAVNNHYERAEKLVSESGISPDVYKETDTAVRQAIESVRPKQGDIIADQIVSFLDEGSEKVMYYLGRNKSALNELKSLLSTDPSGIKAAVYLGQQKERLTNPQKKRSRAAKPESQISGDESGNNKGSALKRKYDQAHKDRNPQLAYNIKKEARKTGVNVSGW